MKYVVCALVALLVAGCAEAPRVVASNERTVMVKADTLREALATADKECAKFGRMARVDSDDQEPFGKILVRASCVR